MNTRLGHKQLAVALLAATTIIPAIATARVADQNADSSSITVSYADLNITTNEGVAVLYRRLQSASRQVCGSYSGRTSVQEATMIRRCFDEALTNAVASTGSTKLAAMHTE